MRRGPGPCRDHRSRPGAGRSGANVRITSLGRNGRDRCEPWWRQRSWSGPAWCSSDPGGHGSQIRRSGGAETPGSAARVLTLWVVRRVTLIVILVLVILMLIDIWGLNMAPFLAVGTAIAARSGLAPRT